MFKAINRCLEVLVSKIYVCIDIRNYSCKYPITTNITQLTHKTLVILYFKCIERENGCPNESNKFLKWKDKEGVLMNQTSFLKH